MTTPEGIQINGLAEVDEINFVELDADEFADPDYRSDVVRRLFDGIFEGEE